MSATDLGQPIETIAKSAKARQAVTAAAEHLRQAREGLAVLRAGGQTWENAAAAL